MLIIQFYENYIYLYIGYQTYFNHVKYKLQKVNSEYIIKRLCNG